MYKFTWKLPANIDIKNLKFQLDNESITLMNKSTEIILPLSYGEHNVSIIVMDRCFQSSEANVLPLDIMKGVAIL